MTYDHWAAASAALRQNLLIPMTENVGTTTVVKIEADGNKTVITMATDTDTNTNFRIIQECLDWVESQLVSTNSMGGRICRLGVFILGFAC